MTITLSALQKQRRDTASNWTSNNPTLLAGEWGIESDTKKFKIGDGSAAWQSLEYVPIPDTNRLLEGNLTVGGDFTVNGSTTTIDTTTLTVEDKNIEIGKVSTPSDTTADGGGITLKGATDKTINWVDSTDSWTFSEHIDLASGKVLKSAGTQFLSSTQYTGNSATTTALATARTIGGVSFDGTANIDLPGVNSAGNQNTTGSAATLTTPRTIAGVSFDGSANISLNNNAITNGAGYIDGSSLNASNLSSGTVPDSRFPATLPAISGVNLTSLNASNLASGTVSDARLPSSISSDITGNAATATALATARTIAGVSFDGTANISLNNNAITNGAGYITATLTNEEVQDIVGAMLTGNTETGITVTYQDSDGTIDFVVASQTDENFTTTLKNKLDGIAASAIDGSSLNASNLSSGTIPDARFPATLPAISGANLTNLPSGSDATKMPLAGGTFTGDVIFSGAGNNITFDQSTDDFVFDDGAKAVFGTGLDFQIYHNGSSNNTEVNHTTDAGHLQITANRLKLMNYSGPETYIDCISNGAVELYYNNSKKFETTSTGVEVTGNLTVGTATLYSTGNFLLGDNDEIRFGAGEDLKIFHDGSDSYIEDTGTGALILKAAPSLSLRSDTVNINNNANSENMARFFANGAVELYYDSVKKFETTSDGVTLRGTVHRFEGTLRPNNSTGSDIGTTSDRIRDIFVYNDIDIKDEGKVMFGDNDDLQIYHDGVNGSYIDNVTGTADLYIRNTNGNSIYLNPRGSEVGIKINPDAAVELYYDNSKKAETISEGMSMSERLFVGFSSRSSTVDASTSTLAAYGNSSTNTGNVAGSFFGGAVTSQRFVLVFSNNNGVCGSISTNGTEIQVNGTSDYRLKENVVPLSNAITRLKTLKPSRFNFKTDATRTLDGFLAHEVSEVVPEAVAGEKDGMAGETFYEEGDTLPTGKEYGDVKTYSTTKIHAQGLDQSKLIPLLTAALQDSITKIEVLESKVAALEAA